MFANTVIFINNFNMSVPPRFWTEIERHCCNDDAY